MADIYQVSLPSGSTYLLKDAKAREDIEALSRAITGGVSFLGITTTVLTDGATSKTIVIDAEPVEAINGSIAIYDVDEFIWSDASNTWHRLGPSGTFRALAYKDTASTVFRPTGAVTNPVTTVNLNTDTVNDVTAVGSLPSWTASVANETLSFSFTPGSLPSTTAKTVATSVNSVTTTAPVFVGEEVTITVS